jgi:hypothetical protein
VAFDWENYGALFLDLIIFDQCSTLRLWIQASNIIQSSFIYSQVAQKILSWHWHWTYILLHLLPFHQAAACFAAASPKFLQIH